MNRLIALGLLCLASAAAHADVYVTDSDTLQRGLHAKAVAPPHVFKTGDKPGYPLSQVTHPNATGSQSLIDSSGLKYFINTNITFSTSSSASGAMSEASYTHAVAATTSGGGTTSSTLNDAFDGYNSICLSLTGGVGPCQTGNATYSFYNNNGAASVDTSVPATPECTNRQIVFVPQNIGGISVQRKVFVPTNDTFERTVNILTNTTGAPVSFNLITGNNLGSDSNTRIVSSSSGDNVATLADNWVSTFQNYSGTTSSDPREGHVLQGTGALDPLSIINFADGDDNPFWGYSLTLAPGQTRIIVNFVTGQPSKAAANAKAAELAGLPTNSLQCLSATELSQITNFAVAPELAISQTAVPSALGSTPYDYTLNVTNNGGLPATSVVVTDTLPAGVTFNSATGTGWSCSFSAGVVICTQASLAPGAAAAITINVTPPNNYTTLTNTATVSSAEPDAVPANNSSSQGTQLSSPSAVRGSKTANGPFVAGSPMTYTITLSNASQSGQLDNPGNEFTDTLDSHLTLQSATASSGTAVANVGTNTVTWNGAVLMGNNVTITITALINAGSFGLTIPNQGTINYDCNGNLTNACSLLTDDPAVGGLQDPTQFIVAPQPNLSISKTGPATATAGGAIAYTLAVSNAAGTATNVSVTDTLAAGVTFVSASGTGWTCGFASPTVTCTLPTLGVAAANPITLNVTAPAAGGSLDNTAAVTSASGDSDTSDNSSTASAVVAASADVSITLAAPVAVLSNVAATFSGTLANAGPSAAATVSALISFPAGYTVQAASAPGYTCSVATNTATCTSASVAAGTNAALSITVLPPTGPSSDSVTGTITTATTDPVPGNNTTTVAFQLQGPFVPPAAVPSLGIYGLIGLFLLLAATPLFLRRRRTQ
jgi:uncharacterized repeat protein (TIGR01451 family)/fimbrial isopeptide formation D2 family protein